MRTWILGACFVALAAAVATTGQEPAMKVGTAEAQRGTTAYGQLMVAGGSDAATDVAVAVVHGVKPGKVVGFIAGSHGTEYASVVALSQLVSKIDPKTLSGTAIIAPLLNVASFEQMTVHLNPIDRKGMNGGYPGNANGTQTERVVALVAEQIVKPSDVIVDLHGGDIDEDLRPYSYWTSRSVWTMSSCATSTPRTRRRRAVSAATRWRRARR